MVDNNQSVLELIDNAIKSRKMAIFCGAGISRNSGLPIVSEIVPRILTKLELNEEDKEEVLTANLRFEVLMGILAENSDITPIIEIYNLGEPNTNHIFIAKMVKHGYIRTILTTNFDLLIEKAVRSEGLIENVDYKVYYLEDQFNNIDEGIKPHERFNLLSSIGIVKKKNMIQIFKIHGSAHSIESIRTTMNSVASKTLSDKRARLIEHFFCTAKHDIVLVTGYSCSDVLDINPKILSVKEYKKMIIYQKHSGEAGEWTNSKVEIKNYLFKDFPGNMINLDTDMFVEKLWTANNKLGDYKEINSFTDWEKFIDKWSIDIKDKSYTKCIICSDLFNYITDFKKSIKYLEASLRICEDLNDTQSICKCYLKLGSAYYSLGDFSKSIEYFRKSLKFCEIIDDKFGISKCYSHLGNAYRDIAEFNEAIEYFNKSIKIGTEIDDKQVVSKSYREMGIIYGSIYHDTATAMELIKKSLEICEEIGDMQGKWRCYTNLGHCYSSENRNKSIDYFKKSLQVCEDIGDREGIAACYNDLGCKYERNTIKEGIEYIEKSLKMYEEMDHKIGISGCTGNLGVAYGILGNYQKATEYLEKCLKICEEIGDKKGKYMSYQALGDLNSQMGNSDKANEYYRKAMHGYREIGDYHGARRILKILGVYYDEENDMFLI
ncbi:tetratricopeptide repeat protein [Methanosarcina mazei]|uniref:Tetratricopeptide repeat protein n=1 Tax=Methanosarcina mazei TaxID=2209 RepID=A0A0F8EQ69_METMZ|nr:tetratricopeptide repeat protein [Methanosarcina mazei]KKG32299.1 hypothetical protein DU30_00895 [Methanosarcina mazei]KKG64503.1 hypothetical protein DU67_07505 [Methanosarcina mazei]